MFLALSILFCISASAGASHHERDGRWWLSVDADERVGFTAGFADCNTFVKHGPTDLFVESWIQYEKRVTAHLQSHPEDADREVREILREVAAHPVTKNPGKWDEPHGYFDGEYWRQASASHRLGFVEGILNCEAEGEVGDGQYARPAKWYVTRISRWYGISANDPAQIDEKRTAKKIVEVLATFKEK